MRQQDLVANLEGPEDLQMQESTRPHGSATRASAQDRGPERRSPAQTPQQRRQTRSSLQNAGDLPQDLTCRFALVGSSSGRGPPLVSRIEISWTRLAGIMGRQNSRIGERSRSASCRRHIVIEGSSSGQWVAIVFDSQAASIQAMRFRAGEDPRVSPRSRVQNTPPALIEYRPVAAIKISGWRSSESGM